MKLSATKEKLKRRYYLAKQRSQIKRIHRRDRRDVAKRSYLVEKRVLAKRKGIMRARGRKTRRRPIGRKRYTKRYRGRRRW